MKQCTQKGSTHTQPPHEMKTKEKGEMRQEEEAHGRSSHCPPHAKSRRTGPCLLCRQRLWRLSKYLLFVMMKRRKKGRLPTCLLKNCNILHIKSLKSYKALMEMLRFQDIFPFYFNVLKKAKRYFI